MYVGARIRRLRIERGLTQTALARMLDLSVSYVNQLENDQRPLSVAVLLKFGSAFDLEPTYFSADSDARLVADLHEALADAGEGAVAEELDDLVARSPSVAKAVVALHRRLRTATDQADRLSADLSPHAESQSTAYEDVRDFFYDRRNHIPELDAAAEDLFETSDLALGGLDLQLARLARDQYGVTVRIRGGTADTGGPKREFDRTAGVLTLARRLDHGQRAFQIATQIAFLTQSDTMDRIIAAAPDLPERSRALARVGLANYFAGALVLPYERFLRAAEELSYDIDLLGARFEVGFETVCHRLSTLQRPGRRGIPFFLVRIDRAGNISKRQSATAFHFSRVGGSCPLWVVHDAFTSPGRIRTQVAQMPDGRGYLWVARTTDERSPDGFLGQGRTFAIGLGCDLAHAGRLVYSRGLALDEPQSFVPIGAGCKVCPRPSCGQRAFPQIGPPVVVDEDRAESVPYTMADVCT